MFEEITELIKNKIKEEASKEEPDIVCIKNLIEITQYVQGMGADSIEATLQPVVRGGQGVRVGPPQYQPSSTEAFFDEMRGLLPQAMARPEDLGSLIQAYLALRGTEPGLRATEHDIAARLRAIIEARLEKEENLCKEVNHEGICTD